MKKAPPDCTRISLPQPACLGCKLFSAANLTVVLFDEVNVQLQAVVDDWYVRNPSRTTRFAVTEVWQHRDATAGKMHYFLTDIRIKKIIQSILFFKYLKQYRLINYLCAMKMLFFYIPIHVQLLQLTTPISEIKSIHTCTCI